MTNEKYVLQQTNKERKAAATGAFHKKNGVKSKKCTLPHEYMTKKELSAMNGEVKSWDLKRLDYTWEDFLSMPDDIKVEYINGISKMYKVGLSGISQYLFNMNPNALGKLAHDKMLVFQNYGVKGYKAKAYNDAFKKAIDIFRGVHENTKPEPPKTEIQFNNASVSFYGFSDETWEFMKNTFKNKDVCVTIQVQEIIRYQA